ncbi:ribosome maturation factor RimM [Mameliella alba]|nr:ribosome maturation factor RimM [Antarctobacter heliothermus]MBY6142970.1 ribosome maturation factor RimM [Mameliella alba]MBY6159825.1 ribosome maturation factor RimM [Mameliella alba]MBY6168296.1 ribosome maturation factor RimM [Mameliella alba]MBY6173317.1 ribosome maturation factor RimM [Mameliella alba]
MTEMICVGAIAGAFGVHGEVRLKSFTSDPLAVVDYAPLSTEDQKRHFDIEITREIKNGFAARLSGVATKEEADALKGVRLFAPRDRLPNLPDDEYYHADLIGLAVFDTGGAPLGKVKAVHNHGATDLLELQLPGQSRTVLLPFTMAAVPTVDLTAGRIVADPPDGLLD